MLHYRYSYSPKKYNYHLQVQLQMQCKYRYRYNWKYKYSYHYTALLYVTTTTTTTTMMTTVTTLDKTATTTATTNYATPHYTKFSSCGWGDHCNHSKKAQPKPHFSPSVDSLRHPCITTSHLCYTCLSWTRGATGIKHVQPFTIVKSLHGSSPGTYKTSTVQAFGSGQLRAASSMESKARIIHVVAATLSKTQLARANLRSLKGSYVDFEGKKVIPLEI